jgi:hypothetical protein
MRTRTKIFTSTIALIASLAVSTPAAHAAEYWASSTSPSSVRNSSGTVLGQAYGRGYNSTVSVLNRATYKKVRGSYGIYVNSSFAFFYYNSQTRVTEWNTRATVRHRATSGTSWYTTTSSTTLHPSASQSRVIARACTDVPFLVPGSCTGNHVLTNSY